MRSNLPLAPHTDVVRRPLTFEARERSFHGSPLLEESLPSSRFSRLSELAHELVVPRVDIDDGLHGVLAS